MTTPILTPEQKAARDEALVRGLVKMMVASDSVKALTDRELTTEVIDKVWGNLPLGSREEWVLDELVARFEKRCGIERDAEGRVIPEAPQVVSFPGGSSA